MRTLSISAPIFIAAALALGCDRPAPTDLPAGAVRLSSDNGADVQWQDVFGPATSFTVFVPCLADGQGESVTVYGEEVTLRMGTIATPSGRYHFHNKISNPGGTHFWAASESGTEYEGHRAGSFNWTSDRPYDWNPTPDTPNTVFHLVQNEHYIADSDDSFKLEIRWWFVLNAEGVITSDRFELWNARCK